MFGFGVVAILFLARENHVSDKHISSHADVGMCMTVCMTVHVFLSAGNCVPGVNGASDDIRWGVVCYPGVYLGSGGVLMLCLYSVSHYK